jgi:hypothetical protein
VDAGVQAATARLPTRTQKSEQCRLSKTTLAVMFATPDGAPSQFPDTAWLTTTVQVLNAAVEEYVVR